MGVHTGYSRAETARTAIHRKDPKWLHKSRADVSMYVTISVVDVQAEVKILYTYTVHGIAEVFFGNLPETGTRCCTPREYSGFNLLLGNPCCNDLGEPWRL